MDMKQEDKQKLTKQEVIEQGVKATKLLPVLIPEILKYVRLSDWCDHCRNATDTLLIARGSFICFDCCSEMFGQVLVREKR